MADEVKKRILVIEDEKEIADIIIRILEKEGYEIDAAYDGQEGLDKIKATKPDLVLLDIMLPKLDGRDLLKMVKQDKNTKEIPVVIISARSEQWDRDIGLTLGAEEYIEKPIEIVKLLRQVNKVFGNK